MLTFWTWKFIGWQWFILVKPLHQCTLSNQRDTSWVLKCNKTSQGEAKTKFYSREVLQEQKAQRYLSRGNETQITPRLMDDTWIHWLNDCRLYFLSATWAKHRSTASLVGIAGMAPLSVTVSAPHALAKSRASRSPCSFCKWNFMGEFQMQEIYESIQWGDDFLNPLQELYVPEKDSSQKLCCSVPRWRMHHRHQLYQQV